MEKLISFNIARCEQKRRTCSRFYHSHYLKSVSFMLYKPNDMFNTICSVFIFPNVFIMVQERLNIIHEL